MKPRQRSPIWPYLAILACLFVLSITAPRAWDRMARTRRSNNPLAVPKPPRRPTGPTTIYERFDKTEFTAREPLAMEPPPSATPPEPTAPTIAAEVIPPVPAPAIADPAETAAIAEPPVESRTAEIDVEPQPPDPGSSGPVRYQLPLPRALVQQLNQLAEHDASARWASEATGVIEELCREGLLNKDRTSDRIEQLRGLARPGTIAKVADSPTESRTIRSRYSLTRWLDIWEKASRLDAQEEATTTLTQDPSHMSTCLADVEALARKGAPGAGWRKYLQLDTLRALATSDSSQDERRAAAQAVLDRMTSYRLTRRQQEFLRHRPCAALETELRDWATAPVPTAKLLADLEAFEHSNLASDARKVAEDFQRLRWSAASEADEMSQSLDTHYRNANLRVAVAAKLANQLVPQPNTMEVPVDDTIVNVPVVGRSTTFAKLSVRFVPDPRRIRIGLEAHGVVDSDTMSSSGPATFYNAGQSTFIVQKLMVLGPQGLVVWPAVSEAENNYTYLTSLETNFDGVPLVGPLVRSIARSQLEDARGQAQVEAEYKLAKRAREHLDAEIRPLIADAAKRVEKEQLATLKGLGLDLVPLALATTEERIVARARLGGLEQLGAHTPRPRAPGDSWLSIQMHQSAINNGLERLDLDGRSFSLPELFAWIAGKVNRPELAQQDDLPDDVHITFADNDAVRVRCEEGRVAVTFAFVKLTHRGKSWQNFTVRTFYLPEAQGLDPRLVRGPALQFDGRSLKGKPAPLLRAIFSKVLSPNRDLSLLARSITSDKRLKGLQITQLVVEDGWIGLAYSPRRGPHNVARRPK